MCYAKNMEDIERSDTMKHIDFKRELEVRNCLHAYIERKNEFALRELYSKLKDDLVNVLFKPLKVLPATVEKQKRNFLYKTQKKEINEIIARIDNSIKNSKNSSFKEKATIKRQQYEKKLNINIKYDYFFQNAREDFYKERLLIDNPNPDFKTYDIFTEFWLSIRNLTFNKLRDKLNSWQTNTYQYFLVVRFAEYYWSFLQMKYRQYYVYLNTKKNTVIEVMSLDTYDSSEEETYKADIYEFKNNIYSTIKTSEELNVKNLPLQGNQKKIYSYLLQGYKNKEIAKLMNIDASTVSTQKSRIKSKLYDYIKEQGYAS